MHLEGSPENTTRRLEQLDRVLPGLYGADHAVWMGDFNFDPRQRSEPSRSERRYRDLWTTLRRDETGYTADSQRNAMRFVDKQRHKRVRFDRILRYSKEKMWRPMHTTSRKIEGGATKPCHLPRVRGPVLLA
jgi:tyrosyl-DNA phosphodiesterase 2